MCVGVCARRLLSIFFFAQVSSQVEKEKYGRKHPPLHPPSNRAIPVYSFTRQDAHAPIVGEQSKSQIIQITYRLAVGPMMEPK